MTGTGRRGGRAPRRHALRATGLALAAMTLAGCMNRGPDEGSAPGDEPDLTFAVDQVTDDRQGGFIIVSGTTWARYDGAGMEASGSLPWHSAAVASLPDGRVVLATAPSGSTQTPQIAVVDLETGARQIIVGRPDQRPLPLAPGEPVSPDGILARDAYLGTVLDVDVLPDGSVLWLEQLWVEYADQHVFVVRRVAADGTLQTLAGRAGDPATAHAAPLPGAAARDSVLDAADPRLASGPDGTLVVATRDWVVRVGADGTLSDVAPGLVACVDEIPLAEVDSDGLVLVRVARSSPLTIRAESWVAQQPSEPASAIARARRDDAACAVVTVPSGGAPTVLEPVQAADGSAAAAFFGDGDLVTTFRGSGDMSALVRLARP